MDTISYLYIKKQQEYINEILKKDISDQEKLSKIYIFTKGILNIFYDGDKMKPTYVYIKLNVFEVESSITSRLINTKTDFKLPTTGKMKHTFENDIEEIIYRARTYALVKSFGYDNKTFDDINLKNKSYDYSIEIKRLCDIKGLKSQIIRISPSSDKINGIDTHYANLVEYNDNMYLIDLTFAKFFDTKNNVIDKLGLVEYPLCSPGYFMMLTEKGRTISEKLIKNGYIIIENNNFKTYLDAIFISFRNGLYYESTNDFTLSTNYTKEDYVDLLKGYKTQIELEGTNNIGYQKTPLKDPIILFNKK